MPHLVSKSLLLTFGFMLLIFGCPRNHITLGKIDCAKKNLVVTVTPTIDHRAGNQSVVTVVIKVTCSGVPVPNVDISTVIGSGADQKTTTDATGTATIKSPVFPVDVSGETVSVVVEASDGAMEVKEKIPK